MTVKTLVYEKQPNREIAPAHIPAVGALCVVLGAVLFGVLAFSVVTNGPLLAWDQPIIQALHFRATHDFWVDFDLMTFVGTFGRETAVIFTVILGLVWFFMRKWREFSMLIVGVVGGNIWFEVISNWVGRHRPVFTDPIHIIPNPGFPSGHSIAATALYGLVLFLIWPRLKSTGWRVLAVVDTVAVVLLIGYSRLYMGDHFPTDVLAGYAFGLFWSGLVYTAIELYSRHRRSTRESIFTAQQP